MVDFTKQAERAEAKRAGRVAALRAVCHLALDEQREALIDALVELDAQIKDRGTPARRAGTGAGKSGGATVANANAPTEQDEGIAALVRAALRGAAPKALTAVDLSARIPSVPKKKILQSLTRMDKLKSKPLVRQGRPGNFRYSLRELGEPPRIYQPSRPAQAESSDSIVERVISALKAAPTADYGVLAQKIFGEVSGANRMRIRNTIYYLKRESKSVRRRPDGAWEVVAA